MKTMKYLSVAILVLFLQACSTVPYESVTYSEDSTVVLINGISRSATYTYIGPFSRKEHEYPVDWGIPELAEQYFREASKTEYISTETPEVLSAVDLDSFRGAVNKANSPNTTETLNQVCQKADADALVILGTKYSVWGDGGLSFKAGGYGVFLNPLSGNANAYTLVGAGVIDCFSLRFTHSVWLRPETIKFSGKQLPKNPKELGSNELNYIKPYVVEALISEQGYNDEVLIEQIARGIDRLFSPDET